MISKFALILVILIIDCIDPLVSQLNQPCKTPFDEEATCILYQKCTVLRDAKKENIPGIEAVIVQSKCGHEKGILVCCGSTSGLQEAPSKITEKQFEEDDLILPMEKCGIQNLQDKIFGGQVTDIDEYPWTALLEYRKNGIYAGHNCGGTIINRRYILTAGHCVVGKGVEQVGYLHRVRLGEYNRESSIDCITHYIGHRNITVCADPHQDHEIEEAIVHKDYDPNSRDKHHDIALLRLKNSIKFTDYVQPICLPLNNEKTQPGQNVTIAGWGSTETNVYSAVKLKANLPVFHKEHCNEIYSRLNRTIVHTQICAGGVGGIDACTGDSGGPIMTTFPDSVHYYIEGIVSFGHTTCSKKGYPSVHTRVTEYIDWIKANMKPW